MSVEAVLFDIGNVLIEWNPEQFYDGQVGIDRRRALFAGVDLHTMNLSVDEGAPFRDSVYDLASRHPGFANEIRMWHDNWLDIASPEISPSVGLLRLLRSKDVPVFALTNFGAETFELARTRYPFFDEFDRTYVSAHLGLLKPDPALYAHVEADCGLPPDRLLFADDKQENVDAAAHRGWRVHRFETPSGWARALVEEGVLEQGDVQWAFADAQG